jgi:hypothetical protein
VAVRGGAASDASFAGLGDRVSYRVDGEGRQGPFRIEAELRYQTIGFRWAENLRGYDAPEPRRFVGFFAGLAPSSSARLARAAARAD